MRIRGLRCRALADGVDLLEPTDVRIPIARIIKEMMIPADREHVSIKDDDSECVSTPRTMTLDRERRRGMILYQSLPALVGFLANHPIRTGVPEIDFCLSSERPMSPARRRDLLTGAANRICLPGSGGKVAESKHPEIPFLARKTLDGAIDGNHWKRVSLGGALWYFPKGEEKLLLCADDRLKMRGHFIPRRRFISVLYTSISKFSSCTVEYTLAAFDGRSIAASSTLESLPAALIHEIETRGHAEAGCPHDIVPRRDLEPIAMLRVPPRREALRCMKRLPAPPLEGTGLFLVDSRSPIPIPRSIRIIDRPADVMSILAHVSEGIFVRGDAEHVEQRLLNPRASYSVLLRVTA